MENYRVVFDPKQSLHYHSTVYEEMPTMHLRWLKKKSGEKVLQQEFVIKEVMAEKVEYKWKDVEEIEEEYQKALEFLDNIYDLKETIKKELEK